MDALLIALGALLYVLGAGTVLLLFTRTSRGIDPVDERLASPGGSSDRVSGDTERPASAT